MDLKQGVEPSTVFRRNIYLDGAMVATWSRALLLLHPGTGGPLFKSRHRHQIFTVYFLLFHSFGSQISNQHGRKTPCDFERWSIGP